SRPKEISSADSLVQALGTQEHCGHVRGLGLGPFPFKVFAINARCHSATSATSSYVELQTQVYSLTSQVNEMKAMMTLMLQNYPSQFLLQFAIFKPSPVIIVKYMK
ncbi:hypothetical protein V8G54_019015, partial [Vigna mungo]